MSAHSGQWALASIACRRKLGSKVDWRSDEFMPRGPGIWSCYRPPFSRAKEGQDNVLRALRNWHPWDPILVATPAADRYFPPILIPGLFEKLHRRTLLQYRLLLTYLFLLSIGTAVGYLKGGPDILGRLSVSIFLGMMFVYAQYKLIFVNIDRVREWSRYVVWIYLQTKGATLSVAILGMLAVGAMQIVLQQREGGFESLVYRYGLVFESAADEWWRYLTGPFIHSSLAHWVNNAVVLVVAVGMVSRVINGLALLAVFLLGTIVPCVGMAALPFELHDEAFVGVSGGVMAILAWAPAIAFRFEDKFPPFFGVITILFSALIVALSAVLNERSSEAAHLGGALVGFVSGLAGIGLRDDECHVRSG